MLSIQVFSGKKKYKEPEHSQFCVCHLCVTKAFKKEEHSFRLGDRVRVVSSSYAPDTYIGKCGTVDWIAANNFGVLMDSEKMSVKQTRYFEAHHLELIKS